MNATVYAANGDGHGSVTADLPDGADPAAGSRAGSGDAVAHADGLAEEPGAVGAAIWRRN